ncbi:MAG: MBL fold metallo-hydrolase [Candidatus Woesearchaeota archaeon]
MQIYILGTSGDGMLTSRQILGSGGIIVKTEGLQTHIDPGPGSLLRAARQGINPRNTTLLLISHEHLNHAADATTIIAGMTYDMMDIRGVLGTTKKLIDNNSTNITVPLSYRQALERVLYLKPGDRIEVEDLHAIITDTKHTPESIGFILESEGMRIGLPGDTGYDKKLFEQYNDCDLLILNMKHGFNYKDETNLGSDDVLTIIEQCRPKSVLLTHFGTKVYNQGPLYIAREIRMKSPVQCQVMTARDGMVLERSGTMFSPRIA